MKEKISINVTSGEKKTGKTNGYKSFVLHAKRDKKRQEAMARDREHNQLSIQQKIELAKSRRGESKREIARLNKKIAMEKNIKAADKFVSAIEPVIEKKTVHISKREVIRAAKAERPSKS